MHSKTRRLRIMPAVHNPDGLNVHPVATHFYDSDVDTSSKALVVPPPSQGLEYLLPSLETSSSHDITYTSSFFWDFTKDRPPDDYLAFSPDTYSFALSDVSLTDMDMTL
jgi:hypothetical protein